MEQRTLIGLAALGVVGGLVYLQKQSSAGQSASAATLGTQSSGNMLDSIFNAISNSAQPVPMSAATLDSAPLVSSASSSTPAFAAVAAPVQTVFGGGGNAADNSAWDARAGQINAFIGANGVGNADQMQGLATWAQQNGVSLGEISRASGYGLQDVHAKFNEFGVLP